MTARHKCWPGTDWQRDFEFMREKHRNLMNEFVQRVLSHLRMQIVSLQRCFRISECKSCPCKGAFTSPNADRIPAKGAFASPKADRVPAKGAFASPKADRVPAKGAFASPKADRVPARVLSRLRIQIVSLQRCFHIYESRSCPCRYRFHPCV